MIKKVLSALFLVAGASIVAAQAEPPKTGGAPPPATAKPLAPPAPHTSLKVGQAAPNFTLPSTIVGADGKSVRYTLSDFKGKKNVVLAFFVFAFTGG
jgi:hypothetical protein